VYHYRSSLKEVSELKAQLNKHVADVTLLKEELAEKSRKCDKLVRENESLERSLKIKVWMYNYLLHSNSPPFPLILRTI
jgi:predicted RNase H-like nuclease (RuvC/YqgF family)